MIHNIKIEQKYYERILTGQKTFEIRKNDRNYQIGDIIHFIPLEDDIHDVYDGREKLPDYEITYLHFGLGMIENYVVLGIKEL